MKDEVEMMKRFSALPADSQQFVLDFFDFVLSDSDTEGEE